MKLSLLERGIVAIAVAMSVVLGLLAYAGFASRGPENSTSGYAAAWLAFWLFTTILVAACAVFAIVEIRKAAARA